MHTRPEILGVNRLILYVIRDYYVTFTYALCILVYLCDTM